MKLTGFIREHDNLSIANAFNNMFDQSGTFGLSNIDKASFSSVINYLEQGVLVLGWMGYIMDIKSNEPLCPDAYYTDGTWIWPEYYIHYLKKHPDLLIENDFFAHLTNKAFVNNSQSDASINITQIEETFRKMLDELSL